MQSQTAKKFAPVFGDDQKVEVAVEKDRAVIRLSTWVEGLGWSCQKTMELDGSLLDEVHRSLAAARVRINSSKALAEQDEGRVLAFPAFS